MSDMCEDEFIRFVVCIDVDGTDTVKAYTQLRAALKDLPFGWETSDEWFHPADDGKLSDPEQLQAARMQYFANLGEDHE